MHYFVHANDVPGRENHSVAITRKYDEIAPDNPHALHMPTHIYTRLGEWSASLGDSRGAASARESRHRLRPRKLVPCEIRSASRGPKPNSSMRWKQKCSPPTSSYLHITGQYATRLK
jgi:hypothetical protein